MWRKRFDCCSVISVWFSLVFTGPWQYPKDFTELYRILLGTPPKTMQINAGGLSSEAIGRFKANRRNGLCNSAVSGSWNTRGTHVTIVRFGRYCFDALRPQRCSKTKPYLEIESGKWFIPHILVCWFPVNTRDTRSELGFAFEFLRRFLRRFFFLFAGWRSAHMGSTWQWACEVHSDVVTLSRRPRAGGRFNRSEPNGTARPTLTQSLRLQLPEPSFLVVLFCTSSHKE